MSRQAGYVGGILLFCCAFSGGCMSPARYVSVTNDGGIVAIPSNTNYWPTHNRDAAEDLMRKKCPEGYVIDREEEIVVGQTKHVNPNAAGRGNSWLAARQIGRVTEEKHETPSVEEKRGWRFWFHGMPSGAPPPPTPPGSN